MRDLKGNYYLKLKTPNSWEIGGIVAFNNVSQLEKESKKLRKKLNSHETWKIDLKNIEQIDSAGLSWLIVNLRYAKKVNLQLKFNNINNSSMIRLISAQGLNEIIKE